VIRGVVAGLVAAHEAGVVHRDLKPSNVMVEEKTGEPLIMDFGIARSEGRGVGSEANGANAITREAVSSNLTAATVVGGVVGTAAYMAPEQARGREVDHRADIYSLGLIFYDLLLGQRRFTEAVSPLAELQERLDHAPPSPRSLDPDIPEAIDAVIMRCLAPDPAHRYQSTADLAADLARLDDEGNPLPIQRRLTWGLVGVATAGAIALAAGTYWFTRPIPPPPLTSVLVADFEDRTNTPVFQGTLENALASGMEGASFITAYPRPGALQLASEIKPGSRLNPEMARLVSAREGIKVVLAGRVERWGEGYTVRVDAIDPAANTVLASADARAASRDRVLAAVASTASRLRAALGDTAAQTGRQAASESVTASSLEALQAYSRAQELADANRNREALSAYKETVTLDPRFGRAWAGMGVVYAILKDEAGAKAAYEEALKHVDRMTDREKLRTLGTYYMMVARNYEKAIENYETLVRLYPADDGGHANLGLAYLYVGNVPRALAEAREALEIYPSQWTQRYNYAMYALYAGDLDTAAAEGTRVLKEAPSFELAFVPVALSLLLKGEWQKGLGTYDQLERSSQSGASLARFGRADLAMYRGRHREAFAILQKAAVADRQAGNAGMLAQDYVAVAESSLALGQPRRAAEAARTASTLSTHESVLFPAALVLVHGGRPEEAEEIASRLEGMLQTHTTAYAQLIRAELAAQGGRGAQAIELFRDSLRRRDTWFGRFLLGRVYAQAGHFPEAMAELDICAKRYGEAVDVFFYDTPSLRYLPPLYYWLGRSQEALRVANAPKTYGRFLALRADADPPDPLVADARERLAALTQ
jgi:tetratricopeptide (TPR) repeat protein